MNLRSFSVCSGCLFWVGLEGTDTHQFDSSIVSSREKDAQGVPEGQKQVEMKCIYSSSRQREGGADSELHTTRLIRINGVDSIILQNH